MMKRHMINWLNRGLVALVAGWVLADEPNAIKSIDVSSESENQQVVTIVTQKPLQAPGSFSVNNPPRIAFDFANTVNDSGRVAVPVASGNLKSIKLAESTGRTRMVLDLQHNAPYDTKVDGNKLVITLNNAAQTNALASVGSTTTDFSVNANAGKESIKDIDFRRGDGNSGRVVIDLSSPKIGIDITQQGKDLVLNFAKTALPRQLERHMDVADFGTPVQMVDSYSQGESAKVVIQPKGNWEYSEFQTDNKLVIEIRNPDETAKRLSALEKPQYKGDKLSMNFQNVEVRTALEVIAEFTGKNIITSDTVSGNLTLRIKDVPWDQILDLILQSKGLAKRENGNVMWIAPREEIASHEKSELESQRALEDIEPLRSKAYQLNYTKADVLQKLLSDKNQPILSKRGSVVAQAENNFLFVQDIPERLAEVEKVIAKLDAPSRQVMIEARIVAASDTFNRQLGARLGLGSQRVAGNNVFNTLTGFNLAGSGLPSASGGSSSSSSSSGGATAGASVSTAVSSFANQQYANVNLPVVGSAGGDLGVSIYNASVGSLISLELQAQQTDGTSKLISTPRVVGRDQMKSRILQGTKIPFTNTTSSAGATTIFIDATLELDVTPRITPDGRIYMDLDITKNSPTIFNGASAVDEKEIHTSVLVGSGDTAVLGGIYESDNETSQTKVPFLGDIPILGNLFKTNTKTASHTELLIFITPKILPTDPLIK